MSKWNFLINANPQNIPKVKGGNNMFYTATKEQVEQLYPDIIEYKKEKARIFYEHQDGTKRVVDRIHNYYFSDKPWGLEQEYLTEGLDQQFIDDTSYTSLNIRNSIVAPDGWTFVSCDYAAQELRLGALNTKGKAFLEAFKNNEDVHLSVAKAMFGEENVKNDKKKYRSKAKTANFALQYGGNAFTLTRSGISIEEATEIYEAYMQAQADHFAVQTAQVKKTKQTMTEHSFFGLPVRLHEYYKSNEWKKISSGERLAKNHKIQSSGADVLSIAFIKLWKNIFQEITNAEDYIRFQITVHDELNFIIRNDVLDLLIPKVLENMQTQMPDWEIPLTMGLSLGPSFGTQYEFLYDPKTFKIIGPDIQPMEKKKVENINKEKIEEEKIILEF